MRFINPFYGLFKYKNLPLRNDDRFSEEEDQKQCKPVLAFE